MEPKYSSSSGLRINLSEMAATSKMAHSIFKGRIHPLNTGEEKCPCGQTCDFASERDWNMKLQMHCKLCSKPVGTKSVRIPKKVMTLREYQNYDVEMMRTVHDHH